MGKQAFNHVLSLLPEGQTWAETRVTFISTSYTVPQNKRLVCRIAIPDHVTHRLKNNSVIPNNNLGNTFIGFSYDINGIFNLQPNQSMTAGGTSGEESIPDHLMTPILIIKSGAIINIKLFSLLNYNYTINCGMDQSNFNNNKVTIENFAYINGFLEDDI